MSVTENEMKRLCGLDEYAGESRITNPSRYQIGGTHYSKMKIQPIDYILENDLSYLQGNVIKYISRYKDKNGIEDIRKAIHYCELIIEKEYNVSKNKSTVKEFI